MYKQKQKKLKRSLGAFYTIWPVARKRIRPTLQLLMPTWGFQSQICSCCCHYIILLLD